MSANRLESELQRLYGPPAAGGPPAAVRALVVELARPADWTLLSALWRGVQLDLQLPAPAIAVSGRDGLQLWFSLQEPSAAAHAAAFLALLQARYLAGVAPDRLRAMPSAGTPPWQAPPVPAEQDGSGHWSAFVAPDLAAVFADTPWLDMPPGSDGQADLLAGLQSITPDALAAAMQRLQPRAAAAPPAPAAGPASAPQDVDPRRFLQDVLNDATVALPLRIEAAKALLRRD